MWWRRKQLKSINDDIDQARTLREEAIEQRAQITADQGLISAVIERRAVDDFGEQVQITFTRRTA